MKLIAIWQLDKLYLKASMLITLVYYRTVYSTVVFMGNMQDQYVSFVFIQHIANIFKTVVFNGRLTFFRPLDCHCSSLLYFKHLELWKLSIIIVRTCYQTLTKMRTSNYVVAHVRVLTLVDDSTYFRISILHNSVLC